MELIKKMSTLRQMGLNNWVNPRNPIPIVFTFRADSRKRYTTRRSHRGVNNTFTAEGYASETSRISAIDARQKADSAAMARAISTAEKEADDWVQKQINRQIPMSTIISINGQGTGLTGEAVMVRGRVPVMVRGRNPRIIYRGCGMGGIVGLPFLTTNY